MVSSQQIDVESRIIDSLRTVYDPEIPANVYDLGLIYEIRVDDGAVAHIRMTLTNPNCPVADHLLEEVREKVGKVEGIEKVDLKLTFMPPWDPDMLSDEVKLELGLL
ncbi:MAG TPA: iron-sulfur cluster assembly protein [Bacteroidales bacterium]|jgi:FeS assembly SUF system protein|nr:iron-sulfur cluster assembly protein [Bacteroidales bacterium]HOS70919.1 iron-sulfur cluster assembly protein [Bacteroidales bacterium]HQH25172.1 iron-sulfur cluster assembly protein [Bacteroidales bacterium]HQJ82399.1 iron-sulfur cluster assembly protein [Bacteroidales bacterium]